MAQLTRSPGPGADPSRSDEMTMSLAAAHAPDRIAIERWLNEGGHGGREPLVRLSTPFRRRHPRSSGRPRVLIAGGGVAGLETLLALRGLAGARVDVTLVAPERRFVNRSMAVDQPFKPQRVRGISLRDIADEFDARWHRGALDRVEHVHRRVVTKDGDELPYDVLVLALGARSEYVPDSQAVVPFRGNRDGPRYRMLLSQLAHGRVRKLAFVKPAGPGWPLPLYDLALLTATHCDRHLLDVELSLITCEDEPLAVFGDRASAALRHLLDERGISLQTNSYGVFRGHGGLEIWPGPRRLDVDRIVTVPRLAGPRLRGVRCSRDGFIHTDAYGRVGDLDGVFAAGDATTFPVKQGGLAAQQADAVAETIAASVGAEVDPRPFRPIVRAVLLTGGAVRYLRADISGGTTRESCVSSEALWSPPNKLSARYLAPFLSAHVGDAADVVRRHQGGAISPTSSRHARSGP